MEKGTFIIRRYLSSKPNNESFTETRPNVSNYFKLGGSPSYDQWFRGDVSIFGGLEHSLSFARGLNFKLEYDPIDYLDFSANNRVDTIYELRKKDSDINVGLSYALNKHMTIDASYIKGNTFNLSFNLAFTFDNSLSTKPKFKPKAPELDLPKASANVAATTYLERRKIDPNKFYYADNFKRWTNTKVRNTFGQSDLKYDEPRIIIPLYYQNNLVGFQGRALVPSKVKYITIMIDDEAPKIYGLDNIRADAPVFVTEGPFDSTFIRNSIAMCGADGDVGKWGVSTPVWVYDNEPRSKEITSRISQTIERGESVVIFPRNIHEKDINDMVLAGHDVQSIVESNIYKGLEANLQFNTWKRI